MEQWWNRPKNQRAVIIITGWGRKKHHHPALNDEGIVGLQTRLEFHPLKLHLNQISCVYACNDRKRDFHSLIILCACVHILSFACARWLLVSVSIIIHMCALRWCNCLFNWKVVCISTDPSAAIANMHTILLLLWLLPVHYYITPVLCHPHRKNWITHRIWFCR